MVMDKGMAAKKTTKAPGERAIRALLEKHACPVPYHEVRTRFLGNIATPELTVRPVQVVKDLWGGELPVFDSLDDVNELLGALIKGLWNELTRHQEPNEPFRLAPVPMEPSAENLGQFGRVRQQELEGFIIGLFNGQDAIDLPERAHEAIGHIKEIRAMMVGIRDLAERSPATDDPTELEATFERLHDLSRIMEVEIHEAVLSCARARRQMPTDIPTDRPTLH
jgi:hypothetical protein